MKSWNATPLLGALGFCLMVGCQGEADTKESSPPPPATEEAVVEETFDSGDTGELSSVSVEETEDEPQGDSQ